MNRIDRSPFLRLAAGCAAAIAAAGSWSASAEGQVAIGVNFIAGFGANDGASVSGVAGVFAQSNWNNVGPRSASPAADNGGNGELDAAGSAANLLDSTGATTSASVIWQADNTWASSNPTIDNDDERLMDGYLDNSASLPDTLVAFSAIPFAAYDVLVYVGSDGNGRTGAIQINNDPTSATWYRTSTGAGDFAGSGDYGRATARAEGDAASSNYVLFSQLSGSELSIQTLRGTNNSGIHGVQIVQSIAPSLLRINTTTGEVALVGGDAIAVNVNGYAIRSANASLVPDNLRSLEARRIDAVDGGLDGDGTPGSSQGETWQVIHTEPPLVIEGFLFGSTSLDNARQLSLGRIYDATRGEDPTLQFEYSLTSGITVVGRVEYFAGPAADADFNGNGTVDGGDLLAWQQGVGIAAAASRSQGDADADGDVDGDDLAWWGEQFGAEAAATTSVPEPALGTWALAGVTLLHRRKKPQLILRHARKS
jgi:hypothetical protein